LAAICAHHTKKITGEMIGHIVLGNIIEEEVDDNTNNTMPV
jgi:hypothetical protein